MPSVYARTLREAERLIGREQLCRVLNVSTAQVEKWLNGSQEPPQSVFLQAVDIVLAKRPKE